MPKVSIRGKKGTVNLTDREHFIARGGEGSVYGKGDLIYKIYHDPKDMIPESKIDQLQVFNHPSISSPKDIILNAKNQVVGFTMNRIMDSLPLCKLFTNSFRKKKGFSDPMDLIINMEAVKRVVHQHDCLIVDDNEFNCLVDGNDFSIPYLIDINAWQTKDFSATAIMPSVRDYVTQGFTEMSDWFSHGIICFMLYTGTHPFRGKHPDFDKTDMEGRMRNNVSMYHKDVTPPKKTRDLKIIPPNYTTWFISLFEHGERCEPPSITAVTMPFRFVPVKTSTGNFIIDLVKEYDGEIFYYGVVHGKTVVKTEEHLYIGSKEHDVLYNVQAIFSPVNQTPIMVKILGGRLQLNADGANIGPLDIACTDKMVVNNTLFLRNEGKFIEISFDDRFKIIPSVKNMWDIMPQSSELFSGVVYQNVMGKVYVGIPAPVEGGDSSFYEVYLKELEEYRIVDMKHSGRVLMVVGYLNGKYDRFVFRFSHDYTTHDCRTIEDVDYSALNFVVLESGLVISITEDDTIEMFSRSLKDMEVKTIKDPDIDSTMMLCNRGMSVMFHQDNKLYSLTMRK